MLEIAWIFNPKLLLISIPKYRFHDWHVQSVVKDRDDTRLSGAFRKEPQNRDRRNHVSSKPFKHIAVALVVSTGASHRIHTEISTVKRKGMCDLRSQIGTQLLAKTAQGGSFERRQQYATFETGRKPNRINKQRARAESKV